MKTPIKHHLPPGRVITKALLCRSGRSEFNLNDVLAEQLRSAELLRRKAYLRLARTVGISWLGCRREALKY